MQEIRSIIQSAASFQKATFFQINEYVRKNWGETVQSSNSSSCFFNDASEDIVWEMFQFTPTNPSQNQIPKSEQKVRNFYTHPFFPSFANRIFAYNSFDWVSVIKLLR